MYAGRMIWRMCWLKLRWAQFSHQFRRGRSVRLRLRRWWERIVRRISTWECPLSTWRSLSCPSWHMRKLIRFVLCICHRTKLYSTACLQQWSLCSRSSSDRPRVPSWNLSPNNQLPQPTSQGWTDAASCKRSAKKLILSRLEGHCSLNEGGYNLWLPMR